MKIFFCKKKKEFFSNIKSLLFFKTIQIFQNSILNFCHSELNICSMIAILHISNFLIKTIFHPRNSWHLFEVPPFNSFKWYLYCIFQLLLINLKVPLSYELTVSWFNFLEGIPMIFHQLRSHRNGSNSSK